MKAYFKKHTLKFNRAAGTSRGLMHNRDIWYLTIKDEENNKTGLGEIAPLPGLSRELGPEFEKKISEVCQSIDDYSYWLETGLSNYPSIRFGLETALLDLKARDKNILFPSEFTKGTAGIPINGLIWMGTAEDMREQVRNKIELGFRCIKLKIGAIDFDEEIRLIKEIRDEFSDDIMEIRVDANGAFSLKDAPGKLEKLAALKIHSIEQPIKQNQWEEMAELINREILPIALDEELIGIYKREGKIKMLLSTLPDYIILKPSLHGGLAGCEEWIELADSLNIGWWITSALESNIGLNAIAQWAFKLKNPLYQGLGTGQLFTNNIISPLEIKEAKLHYNPKKSWDFSLIHHEL